MNGKVKMYGRARRLALLNWVIVIAVVAVIIVLLLISSFDKEPVVVQQGEFAFLSEYFVNRKYVCGNLKKSGAKCTLNSENVKKVFYRYDDGFQFFVSAESYTLAMIHRLDDGDKITFKTNSKAFDGYKNQDFVCELGETIFDEVVQCVSDKTVLDIQSYLGVIEETQYDIKRALYNSGYSFDEIIANFEWKEK